MKLLKLLPSRRPNDPLYTTNIMAYEFGGVVHGLVYSRHCEQKGEIDKCNAYRQESKISLADLVTQCRLLAEQEGWNFEELVRDGEERFVERMEELRSLVI